MVASRNQETDMGNRNTNTALLTKIPLLKSGLAKHFAGKLLTLNNVAISVEEASAQLTTYADSITANATSHAAWQARVQQTDALAPAGDALVMAIENLARVTFGTASDSLADFGLKPRAAAKKSVAVQAEAIERGAATRVARHTVGPNEKAKIHGTAAAAPAPQAPDTGNKPKS